MPLPESFSPGALPERVFAAPWEAQIFALVVKLHEDGHFPWQDFAASLSQVIAAHRAEDDGSGYYRYWLEAALRLLAGREIIEGGALKESIRAVEAHRAADHGHHAHLEPIAIDAASTGNPA